MKSSMLSLFMPTFESAYFRPKSHKKHRHLWRKSAFSFGGSYFFVRAANDIRQAIHPVLVTTYGLANNQYSHIFQNVVTLKDLFKY